MPEKAKTGILDIFRKKRKNAGEAAPEKAVPQAETAESRAERREREFDYETAVTMKEKAPGKGEDRTIVYNDNEKSLLAVLDGMGGQEGGGGDVAAQIVAESFQRAISQKNNLPEDPGEVEDLLKEAVLHAHSDLNNSTVSTIYEKMATTLSAMLSYDDKATVVNVGDSRVYRLRRGELTQLSRDDSVVSILKSNGVDINTSILSSILSDGAVHEVTLKEAYKSANKKDNIGEDAQKIINKLMEIFGDKTLKSLRNINTGGIVVNEAAPAVDVFTVDVQDGDEFLITSDGLTDNCQDRNIEQGLNRLAGKSSQEKAANLRDYAIKMQDPNFFRDANKLDDISIIYTKAKSKKGARDEEIEEISPELLEDIG